MVFRFVLFRFMFFFRSVLFFGSSFSFCFDFFVWNFVRFLSISINFTPNLFILSIWWLYSFKYSEYNVVFFILLFVRLSFFTCKNVKKLSVVIVRRKLFDYADAHRPHARRELFITCEKNKTNALWPLKYTHTKRKELLQCAFE